MANKAELCHLACQPQDIAVSHNAGAEGLHNHGLSNQAEPPEAGAARLLDVRDVACSRRQQAGICGQLFRRSQCNAMRYGMAVSKRVHLHMRYLYVFKN